MSGRLGVIFISSAIASAIAGAIALSVAFGILSLPTTTNSTVAAGPGAVTATSPMGEARAAHTATLLTDGEVLIVGGFAAQEAQPAGAELFNAERESFEAIAGPEVRRQSHSATLLADGRVLIAGGLGEGNRYLDTAELYDPATKRFTMTGRLTNARSNHEAVLLDDDRVLIVGGTGTGWTFLDGVEIYDPVTGTFTVTGAMGEPRESHVAVKLRDGRVLVAGGHRGRGDSVEVSRTAEIYDVATGRFTRAGSMTVRRHKHDAVRLDDGRVLVLGGTDERDNEGVYSSVELFDPIKGEFGVGKPMRLGRYKHRGTTVALPDGRLLLAGGALQAETYDPATGANDLVIGSTQLSGQFSAAALLPAGRVLITGGYGSGRGPRADAWIFRPHSAYGAPRGGP